MRRLFTSLGMAAVLVIPVGASAQITIGFEDLTEGTFMPTSYQGFTFTGGQGSNSWVINRAGDAATMFDYGMKGNVNVWSNGGTSIEFSGGAFDFTSVFMGAGNPTCGGSAMWTQNVSGYLSDALVHTAAVDITCGSASTQVFNWSNVDRVVFASGVNLTLDDIAINGAAPTETVTPEPATMILVGSGLAGIARARRRRQPK